MYAKTQFELVEPQPGPPGRPSRAEAEAAVRTLIRWAGDAPEREGLQDTPARVVRAYEEWFAGYDEDPARILARTFSEVAGYQDAVILKTIPVVSFCEHHMAPIRGTATVGYLPAGRVVGISKLARLVQAYARRLQIQERFTAEIAQALESVLKPKGVGVIVQAEHGCMTTRGVGTPGVAMVTKQLTGAFLSEPLRSDLMAAAGL